MIDHLRFNELDSTLFKAFLFAARELNFTRAAEKAAMTQSGVSQKVARLEQQIGQALFLRVNKTVSLTEVGRLLLEFIERQQDELENLFEELGISQRSLRGPVRYAMPHSCLFTPHFPLLLKAREKFNGISLHVTLCSNEEITELLLKREIDFGFQTQVNRNPGIVQEKFAVEEYVLVGSPELIRNLKPKFEILHKMPFVDYPEMRDLFGIWKSAMAPQKRALSFEGLSMAGTINSLHAAITMLQHGLGFAVVPKHVVTEELRRKELAVLFEKKRSGIKSEIYISSILGYNFPNRVQAVIDTFHAMT